MKTQLLRAFIVVCIALWAMPGLAQPGRQVVVLPGVVGPQGVLNGVDTDSILGGVPKTLTVGTQNINTTNFGGAGIGITSNLAGATINFLGTSTVTGSVGAGGGFPFAVINAGATGTTVIFNGAVNTTAYNVTGTGTVNFNGNVAPGAGNFNALADGFVNVGAGAIVSGALTTTTAGTGTLTLNAGSSVTGAVGGANGIKAINFVGGGASLGGTANALQINLSGGNASIVGATVTPAFSFGTGTLSITGALAAGTLVAGPMIATTLGSNALFGKSVVTGAISYLGGGITVTPTVTGVLTQGSAFTIIDGLAAGTPAIPVTAINNNPRYIFTGTPTNAQGDVVITLTTVVPLAAIVPTPAAAAIASVLDIPAPPGSNLAAVQNAFAMLPNAAAINSAIVQLAPAPQNLAAPLIASQVTNQFEDILMARVEEIQNLCCDDCGPNSTQVNTRKCAAPEKRANTWGKAYARNAFQHDDNNALGYKANTEGFLLAHDLPVGDLTRVGLGVGYANSAINGNYGAGRMKIDSYQVMGYLSHAPGPWFVQGALVAGKDNYDSTRNIVFPGVNQSAAASYSGDQFTAFARVGTLLYNQGFTVTPFASLQYSHLDVDGHTEQGAAGIDLRVQNQKYNFIQSGLGIKVERVVSTGRGSYAPEAHLKWLHDFKSTTMQQVAALTGGGTQFSTLGVTQDRNMFNAGAGVTLLTCDCDKKQWTVKALYDYHWNNSEYSAHQVSLIASRKW